MKEIARVNFGDLCVEVVQGDITRLEADALVNAANNEWLMGGGVAGALKREGGPEIEEEARRQGKKPVGECVVTGAGRLPARYVIHAAVMALDLETNSHLIRLATRNTLKKAQELKIRSLAFPAFGTGVGGFPNAQCAEIMLYELNRFARKHHDLERVVFVLFGDGASEAFEKEIKKYQEI